MQHTTLTPNKGTSSPQPEAAAAQPRKKTMSEAALAANRANAKKSTGPRTPEGKTRSASNAFQHGLYSMRSFHHFRGHPDLAASIIHNLLEEYQPITPTEHILVQQLIHLQLRFIQMEHFFNGFADEGKLNNPDRALLAILRELDRIPARMLKTIHALKKLIAERGATPDIEPIVDPPPVEPPEEYAKRTNEPIRPTGPELSQSITEYIFHEFCRRTGMDPAPNKPITPPAEPAS